MEFQFKTIDILEEKSFSVQKQRYEEYSVIQLHKNYELNLMTLGSGKRIVGNNISSFENNDLILIGPNLPHNRILTGPERINPPECLILYISDRLISNDLIRIKELETIQQLFNRAMSGLVFKGEGVKQVEQKITKLAGLQGINGFIALIQLLKSLTEIEGQELFSRSPELLDSHYKDLDKIKMVYDFILRNIHNPVTLDEVAGLLNMAPGSFSRFFKKRTGKSLLQYVKDIRIGLASKMLSNTEKPVSQICVESGYNNLANFNFYFKSLMKMTPSEYRKCFR